MKKLLLITLISISGSFALAQDLNIDPANFPYTLLGGPDSCSLTVHNWTVAQHPKIGKYFQALVSTNYTPGVKFILKSRNGRSYTGIDRKTRTRIYLRNIRPNLGIPFMWSSYRLNKGKIKIGACHKLTDKT